MRGRVGDILALTVSGDVLDGVEIEEIGKLEPIEPGSPARFEVLLERRGELRVELVDAERLIGLVEVAGPRRLARRDLLVRADHVPAGGDRLEEVRRAAVAQAVVVVVVLDEAGAAGLPVPTAPRYFCAIAPLTVRSPSFAPQS